MIPRARSSGEASPGTPSDLRASCTQAARSGPRLGNRSSSRGQLAPHERAHEARHDDGLGPVVVERGGWGESVDQLAEPRLVVDPVVLTLGDRTTARGLTVEQMAEQSLTEVANQRLPESRANCSR